MYKLEMHVHTSPTSRCASAKAEDAVSRFHALTEQLRRTEADLSVTSELMDEPENEFAGAGSLGTADECVDVFGFRI